jgi:hypothetical protein
MRWPIAAAATTLLASLGHGARADDAVASPRAWPSFGGDVDARLVWIDRPPPVRLRTPGKGGVDIGGLPGDFVPRTSTLFAATAHVSLYVARSDPVFFPVFGLAFGAGGGGYADSGGFGAAVFDRSGAVAFGTLELPGVGLQSGGAGWRGLVSLVPGLDFVTLNGSFHDASVHFDAEGSGGAFSLRAEARVCSKSGGAWLCVAGAPTVLEGESFFNGGYFAIGAML